MSEIAIIGEKDFVFPFQSLGIKIFPVNSSQETERILTQLIQEKYLLIYLSETYSEELLPKIKSLSQDSESSITIIPGPKLKKNIALERLKKISEKAVGVDLFK